MTRQTEQAKQTGRTAPQRKKLLTPYGNNEGIVPVTVQINDLNYVQAIIDTGARSSYASVRLIHEFKIKPKALTWIDILMCSNDTVLETYGVKIQSVNGEFELRTLI